ncbi:MAG: DUF4402 domain-containing protein [Balneolales bacterium]
MKDLFTALFTLALVIGGFNVAGAQVVSDVNVSANVLATLGISTESNINFGNISDTSEPVIDPNNDTHNDLGTVFSIGRVDISGGNDAEVTITFNNSATLKGNGDPDNTMTFNLDIVGDSEVENQGTATAVASGDQENLSGSGAFYLWLGGNLGNLEDQAADDYSSDEPITVSVEYN